MGVWMQCLGYLVPKLLAAGRTNQGKDHSVLALVFNLFSLSSNCLPLIEHYYYDYYSQWSMFDLKLEVITFCCIFKSCVFSCLLKLWSLMIKSRFFNQIEFHQEKKYSQYDTRYPHNPIWLQNTCNCIFIRNKSLSSYSTMEAFRWRLFLILMSSKHSWKLPIKDLIPQL